MPQAYFLPFTFGLYCTCSCNPHQMPWDTSLLWQQIVFSPFSPSMQLECYSGNIATRALSIAIGITVKFAEALNLKN